MKTPPKLTMEHLSCYQPHKLQCQVTDGKITKVATLNGLYDDGSCVFYDLVESEKGFKDVKPLLLPLSELTKVQFTEMGWVNEPNGCSFTDLIIEYADNEKLDMKDVKYLCQQHFDVFGLIEAGLALNKLDYKLKED